MPKILLEVDIEEIVSAGETLYYNEALDTFATRLLLLNHARPVPDDPKSKAFIESLKPKTYEGGTYYRHKKTSDIYWLHVEFSYDLSESPIPSIATLVETTHKNSVRMPVKNGNKITEEEFSVLCCGLPENFVQVKPTFWEKVG